MIAAGGTGGHIYPGIAVARELQNRDPDSEILFVGTPRGLESKIVPREGFELKMMNVSALKGVSLFKKLKSLAGMPLSFASAARLVKRFNPHLVLGVGGYSSGPVLLMASLVRIPTVVVEPNAIPGFTNRVLSWFVDAAAVSFEESLPYFRGRAIVTGNPVRNDFRLMKRKHRGDKLCILLFGGSQGARAINEAMIGALPLLKDRVDWLLIVHQTGERDFERVKAAYSREGFGEADVRPFIHDMAVQFEDADLVICRSGATSVAEVAAAGKAAIFVPFPFATDDHQRKNAEAFEKAGAARMILQKDLTASKLAEEILRLSDDPDAIDSMERASAKMARPDATERTVDLALRVAWTGKGL